MPEELFDVVDAEDHVIGHAPRSQVHAERWLHRAVHIFVFNTRGELLVHKRSATKDECPLKFTSSASGHLHAGEDYDSAAHRELEEELCLKGELQFLAKLFDGAATSYEHSALYRIDTDLPPAFDPDEIESGAFVPLDRLQRWIAESPDDFTPCFRTLFAWYIKEPRTK